MRFLSPSPCLSLYKPSNEVIHTLTTPIHPQDSSIIIGIIVEAAKIMF